MVTLLETNDHCLATSLRQAVTLHSIPASVLGCREVVTSVAQVTSACSWHVFVLGSPGVATSGIGILSFDYEFLALDAAMFASLACSWWLRR